MFRIQIYDHKGVPNEHKLFVGRRDFDTWTTTDSKLGECKWAHSLCDEIIQMGDKGAIDVLTDGLRDRFMYPKYLDTYHKLIENNKKKSKKTSKKRNSLILRKKNEKNENGNLDLVIDIDDQV